MGQEIGSTAFRADDEKHFIARLGEETALLQQQMASAAFSESPQQVAGCEIEAWLLDRHYFPVADNQDFLARLNDPLVVPELSRFNIELNCAPRPLTGSLLRDLHADLANTWQRCQQVAHAAGDQVLMIGTLPTLRDSDLGMQNVSPLNRYYALNDSVMQRRGGRPITLDIHGRDSLQLTHDDVMLEAGTTSFQLHLQVPFADAVAFYNAAQWLAAPMVAVSANSPFLFGCDLWNETRIALFAQAVDSAGCDPQRARVTFGHDWLRESPHELFADNAMRYAPLLPLLSDAPPEAFAHLKLHNGTIWRWNRLLIGGDGQQHVRIEHRVMPAGPTLIDMLANAALFYGAIQCLARQPICEQPFAVARENFYCAARQGLQASVRWCDGRELSMTQCLHDVLLPFAQSGLQQLGVDCVDAGPLLEIIRRRVETGQNGAAWQRAYIAANPGDFAGLTARYLEHQRQGNPVHEWEVN